MSSGRRKRRTARAATAARPRLVAHGRSRSLPSHVLIALGIWQVERRAWKLALIARVEQRVHAPAAADPLAPRHGRRSPPQADEYRHVSVTGRFLHDRETWFRPSPSAAPAIWVLTPLRAATARSSWSTAASCRPSGATASTRQDGNPRRPGRRSPACCASPSRTAASSANNDPAAQPLVFARRRRDRRGARPSTTSRPSSSMPTPDHESGGRRGPSAA